jgi:hypothetical protein
VSGINEKPELINGHDTSENNEIGRSRCLQPLYRAGQQLRPTPLKFAHPCESQRPGPLRTLLVRLLIAAASWLCAQTQAPCLFGRF